MKINKTSLIITAIIVILVVAGGSFCGGMAYGKSQKSRAGFPSGFNGGNFQGARLNENGGNGFVSGDIISKDDTSITLKLPNNSGSKIIFYSEASQISKFTAGAASDLTAGTSISVTGTANGDGSITAQTIQIRPAGQNKPAAQ